MYVFDVSILVIGFFVAAITASYFKDSSCVINSTHPVTYPIANGSCIYSVLNLTAAAFCNNQYTNLIPKTVGDSWNINV